jgi:hypothetical protein
MRNLNLTPNEIHRAYLAKEMKLQGLPIPIGIISGGCEIEVKQKDICNFLFLEAPVIRLPLLVEYTLISRRQTKRRGIS